MNYNDEIDGNSENEYIEYKMCDISDIQIEIIKALGKNADLIRRQMEGKSETEKQQILEEVKDDFLTQVDPVGFFFFQFKIFEENTNWSTVSEDEFNTKKVPVRAERKAKKKNQRQKFDRTNLHVNVGILVRPFVWYECSSRIKLQILTRNLIENMVIETKDFSPGINIFIYLFSFHITHII